MNRWYQILLNYNYNYGKEINYDGIQECNNCQKIKYLF
jgi:hypothetical protein